MSLAVCESRVPDDLSDGHVPYRVSKSLSPRVAAARPLLRVLLSRTPSRHRGESSHLCLPERFCVCGQFVVNKKMTSVMPRNRPIVIHQTNF